MKIEGIFAGKGVATEPTREAGTTMEQRPSENCEDCFWWYEDSLLCEGCPNNPRTEIKSKDRAVGMLGTLRNKVTLALG